MLQKENKKIRLPLLNDWKMKQFNSSGGSAKKNSRPYRYIK